MPGPMPRAIKVTRADRPALRRSSTSPQLARAEAICEVVRGCYDVITKGCRKKGCRKIVYAARL